MLVVFHLSLSDSKFPQISMLSSRSLFWMVSIFLLISDSSCLFPVLWGPSQTKQLHSHHHVPQFFQAGSTYLCKFSSSFIITLYFEGTAKLSRWQVLFILLVNIRSGLLAVIQWSISLSQNPRESYISHFLGWILICVYTIWSNFNLLPNRQKITFPTLSSLVLLSIFFFC